MTTRDLLIPLSTLCTMLDTKQAYDVQSALERIREAYDLRPSELRELVQAYNDLEYEYE